MFTPYIVRKRTPYIDSNIRGSFVGIDTSHTADHFARAVIEGITLSLKESQKIMENVAGKSFSRIVSVGGGAKSKIWQLIQADVFATPVVTLKAEERVLDWARQ
ncbi:FGGY-family carbohydrate kinase [Globicatella sanguinis]|uniref:FGGY-family carbohydrate kinase n=1 Tax=Globicatella sanguinis TaxID=13076 RepID=UPI0008266041|nr:FGGY-family carbohydrate kinase [Globicatella sanguinis]